MNKIYEKKKNDSQNDNEIIITKMKGVLFSWNIHLPQKCY